MEVGSNLLNKALGKNLWGHIIMYVSMYVCMYIRMYVYVCIGKYGSTSYVYREKGGVKKCQICKTMMSLEVRFALRRCYLFCKILPLL